MAQAKLGPRLFSLLFYIAVFFLTAIGLAVLYYGILASPFLFILIYGVAWVLLFAFAADFFGGKGKSGGKKVLVLTFVVMLASALFTYSVWTIVTPRWSFSVSTDKPIYSLGEPVTITASLRNTGFLTHSFKSASSNPVFIWVEYLGVQAYPMGYQVWYSPISRSVTEFTLGPNETLTRSFSWNQTNAVIPQFWNQTYMPGTYGIHAFIPKDNAETYLFGFDNLFSAYTRVNVTST